MFVWMLRKAVEERIQARLLSKAVNQGCQATKKNTLSKMARLLCWAVEQDCRARLLTKKTKKGYRARLHIYLAVQKGFQASLMSNAVKQGSRAKLSNKTVKHGCQAS